MLLEIKRAFDDRCSKTGPYMNKNTLNKNLGLFDVFCIASGAMVSSGLFVLPGLAHALAGPAVVFSYFFAGLLAATGMLSVAEIITAMELTIDAEYDQVLKRARQLPYNFKVKLSREIQKDVIRQTKPDSITPRKGRAGEWNNGDLNEFQKLILKGPSMSNEQFDDFKNLRFSVPFD